MNTVPFLFLFIPLLIQAPITATYNQLQYAGVGYITVNDSVFANPIPGGGANQSWNFSGQLGYDFLDTLVWVTASSTPIQSDSPTSNLASH